MRTSATATLLFTAFVVGCSDKQAEDSGSAPPIDTTPHGDSGDACPGGEAPVINSVACSYPGLQVYEEGQPAVPTLQLDVDADDADADLHIYQLDLFYDTEVDGAVDVDSADSLGGVPGTASSDPCTAPTLTVSQTIYFQGGSDGSEWDFAAVVTDANGLASDPWALTCATPDEDGNGPD